MSDDRVGTRHSGPDPAGRRPADRQEETGLEESTPNAGGPARATGGIGVSSERVGPTGPGQFSSNGEKDTSEPRNTDHAGDLVGSRANTPPTSVGEPEENPAALPRKSDYPSKDPRSGE